MEEMFAIIVELQINEIIKTPGQKRSEQLLHIHMGHMDLWRPCCFYQKQIPTWNCLHLLKTVLRRGPVRKISEPRVGACAEHWLNKVRQNNKWTPVKAFTRAFKEGDRTSGILHPRLQEKSALVNRIVSRFTAHPKPRKCVVCFFAISCTCCRNSKWKCSFFQVIYWHPNVDGCNQKLWSTSTPASEIMFL